MKQEYLMLAHVFKPGKFSVAGWFVSEKLDGVRAYWDGGISRGIDTKLVPYSNVIKDHYDETATGLWSRTGKVIHAPNYWLNQLPDIPLDGELFLGRGQFQKLTSIVSRIIPGKHWEDVRFKVIDSPPIIKMFKNRLVKVRSDYQFEIKGALEWYNKIGTKVKSVNCTWTFEMVYDWLQRKLPKNKVIELVEQERLPFNHNDALIRIDSKLQDLLELGGEGVMFRKPESFWVTRRSYSLLKYKPWDNASGTVVGYQYGSGKLEGLMGALILKLDNEKEVKISGFTEKERDFCDKAIGFDAFWNPGTRAPYWVNHFLFPKGSKVKFKYRELSNDGVPKEARYYR